jgi:hypothetical protein
MSNGCADERACTARRTLEPRHWQNKCKTFCSSATDLYHRMYFKEHDILCWKIMAPYMGTIHKVHADSI